MEALRERAAKLYETATNADRPDSVRLEMITELVAANPQLLTDTNVAIENDQEKQQEAVETKKFVGYFSMAMQAVKITIGLMGHEAEEENDEAEMEMEMEGKGKEERQKRKRKYVKVDKNELQLWYLIDMAKWGFDILEVACGLKEGVLEKQEVKESKFKDGKGKTKL
ncbi:hypothetical protein AX774_g5278 [Zancudomyces culisetae]|uniref:Uncharacterized protein n=1 Tax=Zancudomyces culisetae TaxID=1213189 RepID=A0A1R1PK18_ZANCU|nr:hypothetical protein AX774_g5278 [Zancudomyces culisetae]|eukprot:OMH81263.1 hypothetical protein AX774_g5278 [Zancudomyces culisetae]